MKGKAGMKMQLQNIKLCIEAAKANVKKIGIICIRIKFSYFLKCCNIYAEMLSYKTNRYWLKFTTKDHQQQFNVLLVPQFSISSVYDASLAWSLLTINCQYIIKEKRWKQQNVGVDDERRRRQKTAHGDLLKRSDRNDAARRDLMWISSETIV